MTDAEPTPDDIEALIDELEGTQWEVTDWDYSTGMYDAPELFLTAEWQEEQVVVDGTIDQYKTIKDIVRDVEDDHEAGAPIEQVLDMAEYELEITTEQAKEILDNLRRKGEVYEPKEGSLRTT